MKFTIILVCLIILSILVMDFNNRMAEFNRLTLEKEAVKKQLEERIETIFALETQIAYAQSEAAVHAWAYQNHMVRNQDMPVVIYGEGEPTPTPQINPTPQPQTVHKINQWLLLFFDLP